MPRRLSSSKRLAVLPERKPKRPKGEATDKPRYSTNSKGLCGFWNRLWFPVDIVKVYHRKDEQGEWLYEIRWKDYENSAGEGEEPTNESTYPEGWIWYVTELPSDARTAKGAGPMSDAADTMGQPSDGASSSHSWQFQDIKKAKEPWCDLDEQFVCILEECCQAWMANPLVDCLERTIAGHRYVVDFQQLRIVALEPDGAPPRRLRRVTAHGAPAVDALVAVARRVLAERQQAQRAQLSRTGCRVLAQQLAEPPKADAEGWAPIEDLAQLRPGMAARVLRAPVSGYQYEDPEVFGQTGTVCAVHGYPPVYLKLEGRDPYWFDYQDLQVPIRV